MFEDDDFGVVAAVDVLDFRELLRSETRGMLQSLVGGTILLQEADQALWNLHMNPPYGQVSVRFSFTGKVYFRHCFRAIRSLNSIAKDSSQVRPAAAARYD
jgi:hypothetical protein